MDGAVSGMALRLNTAGFTPEEAFCLAQVAYLKEHKRSPFVPPSVLSRGQATQEINRVLRLLGPYSMGVEAHRQRNQLWEAVFGQGSWHESEDQEHAPRAEHEPESNGDVQLEAGPTEAAEDVNAEDVNAADEDEYDDELEVVRGALRYFHDVDADFVGDRYITGATLFMRTDETVSQYHGFLMTSDGMIGFFEEADGLVENIQDGSPVIFPLKELRDAAVRMPDELLSRDGLELIRFLEPSPDFHLYLSFGEFHDVMSVRIRHAALPRHLRPDFAAGFSDFLRLSQKALALREARNGSLATYGRYADLFEGSRKFLETEEPNSNFIGDRFMVPAILYDGRGTAQQRWNGFLISRDGMIGFFEESDCVAESIEEGSPLVFPLMALRESTAKLPTGMEEPRYSMCTRFQTPADNFMVRMRFSGDHGSMQVSVTFKGLSDRRRQEREESIAVLLELIDKAFNCILNDGDPVTWPPSKRS